MTPSLNGIALQANTLIFELVVLARACFSVLYGFSIVPSGDAAVESARTKMAQSSRMLPVFLVDVSIGGVGSPPHSAGGGGPVVVLVVVVPPPVLPHMVLSGKLEQSFDPFPMTQPAAWAPATPARSATNPAVRSM